MRELISRLQLVPYVEGGNTWAGIDCWGLVEIWYREWLEVSLDHRGDISSSPDGLQQGFDTFRDRWQQIDAPEDHCLVIMRSNGKIAGHVGIFYKGGVLHVEKLIGCVYQPIADRAIARRVTFYFRYVR